MPPEGAQRAPAGGLTCSEGRPPLILLLQWWALIGSAEPINANLGQSGRVQCRFKGESV